MSFQSTHPVRGATLQEQADAKKQEDISIHAPRAGCDPKPCRGSSGARNFNPRTPCGVRHYGNRHQAPYCVISIHAPRAGCDVRKQRAQQESGKFQSTHPVRGATRRGAPYQRCRRISIHAPRAGCDVVLQRHRQPLRISIHAPRAGCDVRSDAYARSHQDFNPRTPCGVRLDPARISCFCANFNPRTPCGVRPHQSTTAHKMGDFNPRTPCGVRLIVSKVDTGGEPFQSTYPVRGATAGHSRRWKPCRFQSTYPVRGATRNTCNRLQGVRISIHVPRAGCDYASGDRSLTVKQTFQSTYPVRGATTIFTLPLVRSRRFQSTYPVRGATGFPAHAKTTSGISIHVPRAGCDCRSGRRPWMCRISIHVPRAGCDGKFDDFNPLNLHKRYKRVLDRPKSTSEQGKNKAKLAYIHVFTVFWGGAKVPELSARFYFAPNTVRLSARPWRHSPLWHRNARCGCDTYPQGSKSADCLRIHP